MEQVIGFFQVPDPFDQHAAVSPCAEADSHKAIWEPLKNDPIHLTPDKPCDLPRDQRVERYGESLSINDKPISEHSPDFIVQDQDTLIVNLLVVSTITQADVNCVRACVNAHRRAAGGVLINFGDQRLTWMNIVQSQHNYYRSSV